jgi:hypothetical protein
MMSSPRLDLVHLAIRSGILGHIQWKPSAECLVDDDPDLHGIGITSFRIRLLLRQCVLDGNSLDERLEARAEYVAENPDDPYWYRAVVPAAGLPHGLFVELRLVDDDPQGPWVEIVSAHRQES